MPITAKVFKEDRYTWYKYSGSKNKVIKKKAGGKQAHLSKGTPFGIRPATSKINTFRLITKEHGPTHVFTLSKTSLDTLMKNASKTRIKASNHYEKVLSLLNFRERKDGGTGNSVGDDLGRFGPTYVAPIDEPTYSALHLHPSSARLLKRWAEDNGIKGVYPPGEMHITVCYSKKPISYKPMNFTDGPREVFPDKLGFLGHEKGKEYVVLHLKKGFPNERFKYAKSIGASHDFDEYTPHISLSPPGHGMRRLPNVDARSIDFPLVVDYEHADILSEEMILSAHFVRPSDKEIENEHSEVPFQLESPAPEWVHHHLNKLKDKKHFRNAVKTGKVRQVSPKEAMNSIGNTGDKWNTVRHDPVKSKRVEHQFKSGKKITTPIVLHHKKSGKKWLLAGHHRLTYNSQVNKKHTPTLHLEV